MLVELNAALLEDAIIYAVNKHKGQKRKGSGLPYIVHPLAVMKRVFDNKESKNMFLLAIAAINHDVIEDCYETMEEKKAGLHEIATIFGFQVASLVEELTLDKSQYGSLGKKEFLTIKMNAMSSYALAVKLCDRLENVTDMKTMNEKFKKRYVTETWYILNNLNRKLSPSHKKLIEEIKEILNQYPEYNAPAEETVNYFLAKVEQGLKWSELHKRLGEYYVEKGLREKEEEKYNRYYSISNYSIITKFNKNTHPSYIQAGIEICNEILQHVSEEREENVKFAEKYLKKFCNEKN